MTTMLHDVRSGKNIMITDLDQSDTALDIAPPTITAHKKQKSLRTISGNFNRRSRSAECNFETRSDEKHSGKATKSGVQKVNNYFNELLQTKDKQMDKLLQRLATLHKFNEQFADENRKLHEDVAILEQRDTELRKQIVDCEQCQRLAEELATSVAANKTLEADVTMLKTLVYRLNVQIESYQDRLQKYNDSKGFNDTQHSQSPPTTSHSAAQEKSSISVWLGENLRTHTLAPLLQSYDEMLRDKEQLIQQYSQEFEHFMGELKRVLSENNRLLQQNELLKRDIGSWREERTRLQAKLDVCRAKAEAQTRKCDLAKEKLVEVMHCYEQKMQTLMLDMEHMQSAYGRCKSELASLKSLTAQPQDSIAQSLQECKHLLEQLKQQHTKEKHHLEHTIGELTERNLQNDFKLEQLRQENNSLKKELDLQNANAEEQRDRAASYQRATEKVKRSRDRLKARLRIALQWAQKLEEGQANIQSTWDALKRLETIVKHKESQVRGLHARHLQEIDKMQKRLVQKEETIRKILKGKLVTGGSTLGGGNDGKYLELNAEDV